MKAQRWMIALSLLVAVLPIHATERHCTIEGVDNSDYIAAINSDHGKVFGKEVVSISNVDDASDEILSRLQLSRDPSLNSQVCLLTAHFKDGSKEEGVLGDFPQASIGQSRFVWFPKSAIDTSGRHSNQTIKTSGITEHCDSDRTKSHVISQVPILLNLGPNASAIRKVEFLHDSPRVIYYPSMGDQQPLSMLQCPVRITWSNGHQDFGYYMEWEDHHQQVRIAFTQHPMQPPSNDF